MGRDEDNSDELSGKRSRGSPDGKMVFQERSFDFLGEKSADKTKMTGVFDENSVSHPKRGGHLGTQELTLSYLCENSKLGYPEKEVSGENLLNSLDKLNGRYKGKEIMVSEDHNEDHKNFWLERDFLQLNDHRGNSSKREIENGETIGENKEKKPKVESLNLSLALPDSSLSLAGSNRVQNGDLPPQLRSSRSVQSLGPSFNNIMATYSNDFTSYSNSHLFSHNPSCSLTRNSSENYDYSVGSRRMEHDQIWNAGEGTNGSVHSRFRPIGDGSVALTSHGGGRGFAVGNRSGFVRDQCNNSLYKMASSDNMSFLPSELPARPGMDTHSGDSRKNFESLRDSEGLDVVNVRKLFRSERLLREIVIESIPVMSTIMQEFTDETVESVRKYLKNIIDNPERRDELVGLQKKLERRLDLTNESLSKTQKNQLEILVALKMGLSSFLNRENKLPAAELVEIFLLERCRNINCRRFLPVDDCDCKICSSKKGFCSECMCPVCLNFDCASNTCSWVGCDTCSHWCHAACGLQKNLIKPGPCLTGSSGATEMQFHCLGCDHASEMFGFVKDVFMSCAKDWGLEALVKELDCVKKIFRGSEDLKGKGLHLKADEMVTKLQNKMITPPEVCNAIFQFFNTPNGCFPEVVSSTVISRGFADQPRSLKDTPASAWPLSAPVTPKSSLCNISSNGRQESMMAFDRHHNDIKVPLMNEKIVEDEWSVKPTKRDGFDSLESLVRVKEAEARMFHSKADEARREIESYRRMVRIQTEKLDEVYSEKLAKLCLQETEERRRKQMEELKALENSHCDYYKMKIRMQSEISGLLKRMEAIKQQLV